MLTLIWQGMWLLDTSTAEQKFFADPNDVPGGYAILSHVWENETDTFQSVRDAVGEANGETTAEKKMAELQKKITKLEKVVKAKARAEKLAKVQLLLLARTKPRWLLGQRPLSEHPCVFSALH